MWDFFIFVVQYYLLNTEIFIMKPKMIVFMGGQGSGKGTFAHMLIQKQKFNYLEAGDILRHMPENSTIAKKVARGELLKDDELFPVIAPHIIEKNDIILDGFPRTMGQAKWLIENYSDKFDITVVFLNISEQKMIAHIQNRIKMGVHRADDCDENAVHRRIESFKQITLPAIEWLRNNEKVKFLDIKFSGDDIDENFAYIYKKLYK